MSNVKAEVILLILKTKQKQPNLVDTGWKISTSNDVKEMDGTVTFDNKTNYFATLLAIPGSACTLRTTHHNEKNIN